LSIISEELAPSAIVPGRLQAARLPERVISEFITTQSPQNQKGEKRNRREGTSRTSEGAKSILVQLFKILSSLLSLDLVNLADEFDDRNWLLKSH